MARKKTQSSQDQQRNFRFTTQRSYGISADVAGREFDRISAAHGGRLTSSLVVDEARPEQAPLHPAFEWDDEKAAERYRQHQASTLIRAVVLVPEVTSHQPEHRAYVLTQTQEEPKPVYVKAEEVVQEPSLFADALQRLERTLSVARQSVVELRDLAQSSGSEPERLARIALAAQALEAAGAAVAALH
jgi:hypothetical protein